MSSSAGVEMSFQGPKELCEHHSFLTLY
jgi:hypothetical protein